MKMKTRIATGVATLILGVTSAFNVGAISTDLHTAVNEGDIEKVKTICQEHPEWIKEQDDFGFVPVHYAINNKNLDMVKCLIEHGANVNAKDNDGNTLLHYAKDIETVKCLVEHGAIVNARNFWEQTPLLVGDLWENRKLNLEIIKYLEKSGADLKAKDLFGNTLLMYAVKCEDLEVVKYLVENNADINVERYTGETPLRLAVSCGNLDIVKYLVEHGADVNLRGRRGYPMVCYAKNLEVARYLVQHNAEVNGSSIGSFLFYNLRELDFDRFKYLGELCDWNFINTTYSYGGTLLELALSDCEYYRNYPYHIDNRDALRAVAKEKAEILRSRVAFESEKIAELRRLYGDDYEF